MEALSGTKAGITRSRSECCRCEIGGTEGNKNWANEVKVRVLQE